MPDPVQPRLREPIPSRMDVSPEVRAAARIISPALWGEPYLLGRGPLHFAGGPYWRTELMRQADEWERMAKAARVLAEVLPDA